MRKWFGFTLLTLLLVLAGVTVFASELLPEAKAYSTYYPNSILRKVWNDNEDALGKRPESLEVVVAYLDYTGQRRLETITLNEENGWMYTFPGEWEVAYDSEKLTEDYKLSSHRVEEENGHYVCTLINGLAYPVIYTWEWEDENGDFVQQGDYYAGKYLPSEEKHAEGESVVSNDASYYKHKKGDTASVSLSGVRVGYVFEGWDPEQFIMPAQEVTVNGRWRRAQKYTVSYTWSGLPDEANLTPPSEKEYNEGEGVNRDSTYSKGKLVTVNGQIYSFSGWSTDSAEANSYYFKMPAHNVQFEGEWEPQGAAYTLTYQWGWKYKDGTDVTDQYPEGFSEYAFQLPDPENYAGGAQVQRNWNDNGREQSNYASDPSKYRAFVFTGWKEQNYDDLTAFEAASEVEQTFTMPANDLTLYGYWEEKPTYSVRYSWTWEGMYSPPSSPSLSQPSYPYFAGKRFSTYNSNYKEGSTKIIGDQLYRFSGWTAYNADDTNEVLPYDNKENFDMPEKNILFKGEWKKVDSYTVEYKWDGLPEKNVPDAEGYICYSHPDEPKDYYSPYMKDAKVRLDTSYNAYISQDGAPVNVEKAYAVSWSKTDAEYNTVYKNTYHTFSGWTAYAKESYDPDNLDANTPLTLTLDDNGYFAMPGQDIVFVGHWKEVLAAPYTVAWYKLASEDAEPETAQLIVRKPNPVSRTGIVGQEVAVTELDTKDINEYTMCRFLKDYKGNVTKGTVLADGSLALKLYFVSESPTIPETGSLTVSKTVTGDAADKNKDFNFTVTLKDTSINGTLGDMTFSNGEATFTLKDGQSKTASGLPAGTAYTVAEAEANQDGYTTAATGANGTITKNGTATAKFTNTKGNVVPPQSPEPSEKTGGLTVSKTVTGSQGDTHRDFTFKVTLDDTTLEGEYGEMAFHAGVAVFTLKHGESMTARELPVGIRYTVEESDNEGYTVTKKGEAGTIKGGETASAQFVNKKGDSTSDQPTPTPEPGKPSPTPDPSQPNAPSVTRTPEDFTKPYVPTYESPKTGDASQLSLWLLLMGVSCAGVITAWVMTRRQRKRVGDTK